MEEEPEFSTFWGTQVLTGKSTAFVPPGEVDARLHLSTVRLSNQICDFDKFSQYSTICRGCLTSAGSQ